MRAIIAGGRYFIVKPHHFGWLSRMHVKYGPITEVVSGTQLGGDAAGEVWAAIMGLPVKRFEPRWQELGDHAGPVRNQTMARYVLGDYDEGVTDETPDKPGLCLLFPGGAGTESMRKIAKRYKLKTLIWGDAL